MAGYAKLSDGSPAIQVGGRKFPVFKDMAGMLDYWYQPIAGMSPDQILDTLKANIATGTTGVRQAVIGRQVFNQIATQFTFIRAIPKGPMPKLGFRVRTALPALSANGALGETDALPSTVVSSYVSVNGITPKIYFGNFEVTQLAQKQFPIDDAIDPWEEERQAMQIAHMRGLNADMLYVAGFNITGKELTSIDRIISSNAEIAVGPGIAAGEVDIYGVDRDGGAGWTDAIVEHNSDVDRLLSTGLMDTAFADIWAEEATDPDFAGELIGPNLIFTGLDSWVRLGQLLENERRYFGDAGVSFSNFGGVQSLRPGVEGAFHVTTYNQVPILTDPTVVKDTISRIYLINTNYLQWQVLMPTQYYEQGATRTNNPWLFASSGLIDKGGVETISELVCTKPHIFAKIRDLK